MMALLNAYRMWRLLSAQKIPVLFDLCESTHHFIGVIRTKTNHDSPTVHEEISINVKQARHTLQEVLVEQFIPNDITLAGGRNPMLVNIITGHNGSGWQLHK